MVAQITCGWLARPSFFWMIGSFQRKSEVFTLASAELLADVSWLHLQDSG